MSKSFNRRYVHIYTNQNKTLHNTGTFYTGLISVHLPWVSGSWPQPGSVLVLLLLLFLTLVCLQPPAWALDIFFQALCVFFLMLLSLGISGSKATAFACCLSIKVMSSLLTISSLSFWTQDLGSVLLNLFSCYFWISAFTLCLVEIFP